VSTPRILIAADAEIDGRPLALEPVYYPTLVGAYARAVRGAGTLVVAVPSAHHAALRSALEAERCAESVALVEQLPTPAAADIQLDLRDVHLPSSLRSSLRNGRAPLGAPAWTVRDSADLSRAAATLERHDMYVVARYLVIPVARRLAHLLLPTRISPNTVTAASCLFGVAAAFAPFLLAGFAGRALAALLIHLSVTLDFTDGYLARLRGTDSRTGYWLDTVMDEVVKFTLFLGMTALVLRDAVTWALVPALIVLLLYHVLTSNHWISKSLEQSDVTTSAPPTPRRRAGVAGAVHRVYERLSYLDVHLYLVAASLLLRAEAYALALFALVYVFRFVRMLVVRLASPPEKEPGR
jgi:phosphatidylglycerophosphate synthase